MDRAEGQEARLILLDVDAAHRVDRLFEQVQFPEDLGQEQFEVDGQHIALAAGAEHDVPRDGQQGFRVQLRGIPPVRDEDVRLLPERSQFPFEGPAEFFDLDPFGRCTGNRPLRRDPDGLAREERCRDVFDALRILDDEPLFPGPLVDGEHVVDVGGRRDDRCGTDALSDGPGQVVGAAQVSGEDGDSVGAALIDHDDGGVGHLALHEGRDGPHRDAGGTDEHEGVGLVKHLGGPLREAERLHRATVIVSRGAPFDSFGGRSVKVVWIRSARACPLAVNERMSIFKTRGLLSRSGTRW